MFEFGSLSFIQDFVNSNIVNVVYRNNDILNTLVDLFMNIAKQLGFSDTNSLTHYFLYGFWAFILLYLILHATIQPKKFFEKYFGIFEKENSVKSFARSEIVQLFLITIIASLMLMPAKIQYVKMDTYIPENGNIPTYSDLSNHPKGEEINTIGIIAFSLWLQSRFIYGVQTSNGPAPDNTPIHPFSLNAIDPDLFYQYFTQVNVNIDGHVYVYDYLRALQEIDNIRNAEKSKFFNILDSQLAINLGIRNFTEKNLTSETKKENFKQEWTNIFDVSNNTAPELRDLYRLLSDVEGQENIFEIFSKTEGAGGYWDFFVGGVVKLGYSATLGQYSALASSAERMITGMSEGDDEIQAALDGFDKSLEGGNGLYSFISFLNYMEGKHSNNKVYNSLVDTYIQKTITGQNPISMDDLNCDLDTDCLYLKKISIANDWFLKFTYQKLLNQDIGINNFVSVDSTPSQNGMDLTKYSSMYFSRFLINNLLDIYDKTSKLPEDFHFKTGIKTLFLLSFLPSNNISSFFSDINEINLKVKDIGNTLDLVSGDFKRENNINIEDPYTAYIYSFNGSNSDIKAFLNEKRTLISDRGELSIASHDLFTTFLNKDILFLQNGTFMYPFIEDKIQIDFSGIFPAQSISAQSGYTFQDKRIQKQFEESFDYITNVFSKTDIFKNFYQPLTEQLLFKYLFLTKGMLYHDLLSLESQNLTYEKIKEYNLRFSCTASSGEGEAYPKEKCQKISFPIENGSNLYLSEIIQNNKALGMSSLIKYSDSSANTIQKEIEKVEMILNAINSIPFKDRTPKYMPTLKQQITLDRHLLKKYLNILYHFKKKGNTNSFEIDNNDELYTVFKTLLDSSKYIYMYQNLLNIQDDSSSIFPVITYDLYFFPNAIAYFENNKKSSKELDKNDLNNSISALYDFLSPNSQKEFTQYFGFFEIQGNYLQLNESSQSFDASGTVSSSNINKNTAIGNFYKNLELMTQLQNETVKVSKGVEEIDGTTPLDKNTIENISHSISIAQIPGVKFATGVLSTLGQETADLLTWAKTNFGEIFALKIMGMITEPFHFIFGKTDYTSFSSSIQSNSVTKGILEKSSDFHMSNISLSYSVNPSIGKKLDNFVYEHATAIGNAIITIATLMLPAPGTGLVVGGLLKGIAGVYKVGKLAKNAVQEGKAIKSMEALAVKYGSKGKNAAKGVAKGAGKIIKGGITKFKNKSFVGKIYAVFSFLSSLAAGAMGIIFSIMNALVFSITLFLFVLAAIVSIFSFLIQFLVRIAMPLGVGVLQLAITSFTFPFVYLAKDVFNEFDGSMGDLADNYINNVKEALKILFKLYALYIFSVIMFSVLYKSIMGIITNMSLMLMFQYQKFDIPIASIILLGFWITSIFGAKILMFVVPENQISKLNVFKQANKS